MNEQPLLIAEVDEDRRVSCLWRVDPGKKPKYLEDASGYLQHIDKFYIYGAPRGDVEAWLRREQR